MAYASRYARIFLFLALGFAAQTPSKSRLQYRPPGELVDVGEYRVHIYCTGQGDPPAVVASGGFSFDWALVQPKVARFTRICTYDPSGTAWSDRAKPAEQVSCGDRTDELHRLLNEAHVEGPYVLVGFSIGGLVARLYAARYPSEIAGMVLVDHAFIETGGESAAAKALPKRSDVDTPPVLISQTPIALDLQDDRNFAKLPEEDQARHRWALSVSDRPTPEMAARCFSEVSEDEPSSFPIGSKPLVVISTNYESLQYAELQRKLLRLSRNSVQLVAQNSTHMVIIDDPEIVVKGIQKVVYAVRAAKHALK